MDLLMKAGILTFLGNYLLGEYLNMFGVSKGFLNEKEKVGNYMII